MHRAAATALVLIAGRPARLATPGANPPSVPDQQGMFRAFSDIHFDPFADSRILEQLGAKPLDGCKGRASTSFSKLGADTNYPLLKSMLDNVAATAASNHIRYDYVILTGDLLAHQFDDRFRECVGGGDEAYRGFTISTVKFVDGLIAKALPGVPVFAALGNNDSDSGDYAQPSKFFLEKVGQDWSREWGNIPVERRQAALATFTRAGNYALANPTVPSNELVILNSNLWVARNSSACGIAEPDPDGQFAWLGEVLARIKRDKRTATLVMHVLPGIDASLVWQGLNRRTAALPAPFIVTSIIAAWCPRFMPATFIATIFGFFPTVTANRYCRFTSIRLSVRCTSTIRRWRLMARQTHGFPNTGAVATWDIAGLGKPHWRLSMSSATGLLLTARLIPAALL